MMNKTLRLLVLCDVFFVFGLGLIQPILAIFIKENLVGGTVIAAGVASTIFIITKCVLQFPFSKYVDTHDDKITWLIVGTFLMSFVPFIYIFASHIYHIYAAQLIHGIGAALAVPTFLSIWTANLDKNHAGYEWTVYTTLTGLGTATSAVIGATLATYVGFKTTFIVVGVMELIGGSVLFSLEKSAEKKRQATKKQAVHHHAMHLHKHRT